MATYSGEDLLTCSLTLSPLPSVATAAFGGQVLMATVVVSVNPSRPSGTLPTSCIIGLDDADGALSYANAIPAGTRAKADVFQIQRSTSVGSWMAVGPGAEPPGVVPILVGGYWDLDYAAQWDSSPLRIRFGNAPNIITPWTLRYLIKVREGATGKLDLRAWAATSQDWFLIGGRPAESAVGSVYIGRNGLRPSLTAPTALTATAGVCQIALAWTWPTNDTSVGQELRVIVQRAETVEFYPTNEPGPWSTVAQLPPGATSWTETDLLTTKRYLYRVRRDSAFDTGTYSPNATAQPSSPGAATAVTQIPNTGTVGAHGMLVSWPSVSVTGAVSYWSVQRSHGSSPGTWAEVARVDVNDRGWVDLSLRREIGSAAYWYRIVALKIDSSVVATGTATATAVGINEFAIGVVQWSLSLNPGYPVRFLGVGGRVLVYSKGSRGLTYTNARQYPMAQKPLVSAGVLTAGSSGVLTGDYVGYAVLLRLPETRCLPNPVSNTLTVTSKHIVMTLPNSGGSVQYRDIGYDQDGTTVPGADSWEFYLQEINTMDKAVLVGTYPTTTVVATTPDGLSLATLSDGTRRPMETGFQSLIPPAVGQADYKDGRVAMGEEAVFKPTGPTSKITFTNGALSVTATNYAFDDAIQNKTLVLGGKPTVWQVRDVRDTGTIIIYTTDPVLQASGWQDGSGDRFDFSFEPQQGMVWFSSYFNGEALGGTTFSPETVNPATSLATEVDADDGHPITSIRTNRDAWIIAKENKTFAVRGGGIPDGTGQPDANGNPQFGNGFAQDISPFKVEGQRGIVAANTVSPGLRGDLLFLAQDGPALVSSSGIEPLGVKLISSRLFQDVFETGRLKTAVACYLPDRGLYIMAGIDAKGRRGGLDGLVWQVNANWMARCRFPRRITALRKSETDYGITQALFGDDGGMIGVLMALTSVEDDVDLSGRSDPWQRARSIPAQVVTSPVLGPHSAWGRGDVTMSRFSPVLRSFPGAAASTCSASIQTAPRMGSGLGPIEDFDTSATRSFTTFESYKRRRTDEAIRGQAIRLMMTVTAARGERVQMDSLDCVVQYHQASHDQAES